MTPYRRPILLGVGIAYLIGLHALMILMILKTDFLVRAGKTLDLVPPEEWTVPFLQRALSQARQDALIPSNSLVLLGDSIAAEVDPLLIATDAVNFGIGGDTTRTLAARLPTLRSVTHGRAVVIEVGVNDLKYRPVDAIERDYDALLAQIGGRLPIVALSVLPVDEAGFAARKRRYLRNNLISELNRAIGNACKQHANCRFVDAWSAMQDRSNYGEDGWHLSYAGVHKLAAIIARALQPL